MTISNPIIRIVDDEAVVRKALKFLLESEGWTVEAYEKGSEFLVEDRPSLIGCLILDVAMPEMNGLELYQRLRERKYEVPVIFLTGHGDVDMAVQAMKDGAIDFIQKSINEERLLSAVAKAVRYDETPRDYQHEVHRRGLHRVQCEHLFVHRERWDGRRQSVQVAHRFQRRRRRRQDASE